ncbi:MAG TPA: phosphoribulokinase, partial [Devosiaceae bacterium]|nr:phosphoribulokinase [Devosiaceae bacterium]
MTVKHPVISVTGSSGAGTTTVQHTFDQIFRREGIKAATIEGDAFHRFNRAEMAAELDRRQAAGDRTFSHFSYEANILETLEETFRDYGETGSARSRRYVHSEAEAEQHGVPAGEFTAWGDVGEGSDLLFYEGLHGAVCTDTVNVAQ